MRGFLRTFFFVFAIVVVLSMAVVVLPLLPILFSDELPSQPTAITQQQPAQQAPAKQAVMPCEPPESVRCREERGEEIQGIKLDFGSQAGPSFVETFGWWTLAALIMSALIAGLTKWTVQQIVPYAIGVVVILAVIQNWWLFFAAVALLVLTLIGAAVKNIFSGIGKKAGGALPKGVSALAIGAIIWEIIQTLWTTGTIGGILGQGNQNQPPVQPPAQNP